MGIPVPVRKKRKDSGVLKGHRRQGKRFVPPFEQLKLDEEAGKTGARLNSGEARKRADTLQARLERRLADLKLQAQIATLP